MSSVSNYSPYAPNDKSLTEVLIDLKSTMAASTLFAVSGFQALAFEDVNQGQALFSRTSDGKVGRAIANDTFDKANVVGIAQTTKLSGELVRVLIVGLAPATSLSAGAIYYLSAASAGSIVTSPPSTAGQFVTRIGEAASASELIVQLEPPILLS